MRTLQSGKLFQSYLASLKYLADESVAPEGYYIITTAVKDFLCFVSRGHASISQRDWAAISARGFCEGAFPCSAGSNEYFLGPPWPL